MPNVVYNYSLLAKYNPYYSLHSMFSAFKVANVYSLFYKLIFIPEIFLSCYKNLYSCPHVNSISTHNAETTWTVKMTTCYHVSWNPKAKEKKYAYRFDVLLSATHVCTLTSTM